MSIFFVIASQQGFVSASQCCPVYNDILSYIVHYDVFILKSSSRQVKILLLGDLNKIHSLFIIQLSSSHYNSRRWLNDIIVFLEAENILQYNNTYIIRYLGYYVFNMLNVD